MEQVQGSNRAFFAMSALLFAASAAVTIVWCGRMSEMGMMPMPGGWSMSMTWMRLPGQSWPGAAASFLAMWLLMMMAMMLPSLVPTLWRYRGALGATRAGRRDLLTVVAAAAYFLVWAALGMVVFPLGVMLADAEMQSPALSRAAPLAAGVIVVIAGGVQFTDWKARSIARCGALPVDAARWDFISATRFGLWRGVQCIASCAGLTAVLLATGMMDLRAMALVTAAITAERLAGAPMARMVGAIAIMAGLYMIARVSGLA